MVEPYVRRTPRSSVRIDDAGVSVRSWLVTRRWRWEQIAAAGWDVARDGLEIVPAIVGPAPIDVTSRCLHFAIHGDEFVKEVPCVLYEPSSIEDPQLADIDRMRAAIGDWVDRLPLIAPSSTPFQRWWLAQLSRAEVTSPSDEERIARIRDELRRLDES